MAGAVCQARADPKSAQQNAKQTVNRYGETLMVGIILQFDPDPKCELLVPEQFHTEYNSPLRRSEVLLKSMADAQLYPQIPFCASLF